MISSKDFSKLCKKQNHHVRVSYNIDPVFFKFKEDKVFKGPDLNTIEGLLLKSYLDQYNLSVKWIDENGFWGTKEGNGTFNGVVGRVGYGGADVGISIIRGVILFSCEQAALEVRV